MKRSTVAIFLVIIGIVEGIPNLSSRTPLDTRLCQTQKRVEWKKLVAASFRGGENDRAVELTSTRPQWRSLVLRYLCSPLALGVTIWSYVSFPFTRPLWEMGGVLLGSFLVEHGKLYVVRYYKRDDPSSMMIGLNVEAEKFKLWLQHHTMVDKVEDKDVQTRLYFALGEDQPDSVFHQAWKAHRLISQRPLYFTNTREEGGLWGNLMLFGGLFESIVQDDGSSLVEFLRTEYTATEALCPNTFYQQSRDDQITILQDFMDWFRSVFPYFYDGCSVCGQSSKSLENALQSMLGCVAPVVDERSHALHTELYHCEKCNSVTKFPRYESVTKIVSHRRGRCGEYSHLLYKMFRSLGHNNVRWVADIGNGHVWVELGSTNDENETDWISLDPCEAAVDRPLLYEEWGRTLKTVIAWQTRDPVLEDVTQRYTTQTIRRQFGSGFLFDKVRHKLGKRLSMYQSKPMNDQPTSSKAPEEDKLVETASS